MIAIVLSLLITYVVSRLQVLENAQSIRLDRFAQPDDDASASTHMHMVWNAVRFCLFVLMGLMLWRIAHLHWIPVSGAMILLNFGYSYVLRTNLNKAMKWPKYYLGGTAWYDAFWLARGTTYTIKWFMQNHQDQWNSCERARNNGGSCWYCGHVMMRGQLASRFEMTCTFIAVGVLVVARYV